MKVKEKQICRLCFEAADNECDEINEIMGDMLEVLLLELNWNIIENRTICNSCTSIIKRLFYFKSVCVHIEKLVTSFAIDNNETRFELKDIVQSKRGTEMTVKENPICRLCLNPIKENYFVPIENLMDDSLYKMMLPVFMAEMDFTLVENPVLCILCKENLECYFILVRRLLNIKNEKDTFCQNNHSHGINDNLREPDRCAWTHSNKGELTTSDQLERVSSCGLMKIEEILNIKDEEVLLNESGELVHKMHKCASCSYATKYSSALKRHSLTHKDSSEIDMYKCSHCLYETKWKHRLRNHMKVHKDACDVKIYKCDLCGLVTKYRDTLQRHALSHKNTSEVNMYKCSQCSYETRWKGRLMKHLIVHKEPSQVKMYKCESCAYETRYLGNLQRHALTHKCASKVDTYKCANCFYVTKSKSHLKNHMKVHRNASEIKSLKCGFCNYTTKYKYTLRLHTQTHKDAFEQETMKDLVKSEMHKCELCTFATPYKSNLQQHTLTHKNESEVKMYKCTFCQYATKWKHLSKRHVLIHKDASEVQMFKCSMCPFETKYRYALKRHLHIYAQNNSSEVKCRGRLTYLRKT